MNEIPSKVNSNNDWVVCYMDILGYKNWVMEIYQEPRTSQKKINDIKEMIYKIMQVLPRISDVNQNDTQTNNHKVLKKIVDQVKIHILSDSILILLPLDSLKKVTDDVQLNEFYHIGTYFHIISYWFTALICGLNRFVRGAIAIGPHHQSLIDEQNPENQFIFSKALVLAFELEKKAVFPRILIDQTVIDCITVKDSIHPDYIIKKDFDGLYFLNTYRVLHKDKDQDILKRIRYGVERQVKENEARSEIVQKYYYFSQYHNDFLKNKMRYENQKLKELSVDIDSVFYNRPLNGREKMSFVEKSLKPKWCLPGEGLMGWLVIHADHRDPIGLKHLEHAKIECIETGRSVYCRIRGPGRSPNSGYNRKYGVETVRESIFMDAYYQRKLSIENNIMNNSTLRFRIEKPTKLKKWCYILRAGLAHPNDGVKIGAWLGILSIFLGALSIILAFFI